MLLTLHSSIGMHKTGQAVLKGREQKLKKVYKHWQVIGGIIFMLQTIFKLLQSKLLVLCPKTTFIPSLVSLLMKKRIDLRY